MQTVRTEHDAGLTGTVPCAWGYLLVCLALWALFGWDADLGNYVAAKSIIPSAQLIALLCANFLVISALIDAVLARKLKLSALYIAWTIAILLVTQICGYQVRVTEMGFSVFARPERFPFANTVALVTCAAAMHDHLSSS